MGRIKFRIGTKLGVTAGIGVVLIGGILVSQMLGNWSQTAVARAQIDALEIGSAPSVAEGPVRIRSAQKAAKG